MTTTKALIIPAAGSGSRMQKEIPKPYLKLKGRTILERTITAFLPLGSLQQILVATSEDFLDRSRQILGSVLPDQIAGQAVIGGTERQHSIHRALHRTADVDLVVVHDAVRPFVKLKHIEACCRAAAETGAALVGIPARDTIKRLDERHFVRETPPRSLMWQAQTPQVFRKALLTKAYRQAEENQFTGTDDASLVERLGETVKMVEGDRTNIKLTYPVDLELAKLIIDQTRN